MCVAHLIMRELDLQFMPTRELPVYRRYFKSLEMRGDDLNLARRAKMGG